MNDYVFEFFYRYGKFDKEFDTVSVTSDTVGNAREYVKTIKRLVITGSIKLISINGLKV